MAQRTQSEDTMSRAQLAGYFMELAEEFESGDEEIRVPVGNKTVTLGPPKNVDVEVEVVERSSRLRGDRETIDINLTWKR